MAITIILDEWTFTEWLDDEDEQWFPFSKEIFGGIYLTSKPTTYYFVSKPNTYYFI